MQNRRPTHGVPNALRHQLGGALHELDGKPAPRDVSVHEARKQIKLARASLRLLRETIGEATYQQANRRLRDAARPLARVRDAKALIDVSATLRADVKKAVRRSELTALDRVLRAERQRVREQLLKRPATLRNTRRTLDDIRSASRRWPAPTDASLRRAVERIYRKSRKAFARTKSDRRAETLHESRKQTKYLAKALKLLSPVQGGRIARRSKRAKAITDALGDAHDLTMLRKELVARPRTTSAQRELLDRIDDRCRQLRREAEKKGRRLYRHKAKAFVAGIDDQI